MGKGDAFDGRRSVKISSVTLYKETLPKNPQVGAGFSRRSLWGKTVADVTSLRTIPYSAKALFDAFSQHGKGREVVALSQVQLAEAIGGDRGTVQVALAALERVGLIEKYGAPVDQIQAYRMMHPALLRRDAAAEIVVARKVQLSPCAKCRKPCVPSGKTGWCRGCTGDIVLDGKIFRKVEGALNSRGIVSKDSVAI